MSLVDELSLMQVMNSPGLASLRLSLLALLSCGILLSRQRWVCPPVGLTLSPLSCVSLLSRQHRLGPPSETP